MSASRHRPARGLAAALPALALAVALAWAGASPATAQSGPELRSLTQKVERLQRELNALQRAYYRGEAPPPEAEAAASEGGGLEASGAARIQRRLDRLESEIGELTGQIEETRFRLRKLTDRLDTLVADVDYRLRELEAEPEDERTAGQEGRTAEAQDGGDAGEADSGPDADAQAAAAGSGGGEGDSGPRTLGQVSRDAVESIRSQKPDSDDAAEEGGDTQTASAESGGDGYALPEGEPEARYEHAFGLLRQADYAEAEKALRAFVAAHPEHELAGNAKYWLGETFYVRENYNQAAVTFAEGFQAYPDSSKAPDNLLKLGMSLARIERREDACGIFAELLSRYPDAANNIRQRAKREQQHLGCEG